MVVPNYHIITIKAKDLWITENSILFFQLGKRKKHEALIEKNYDEITRLANEHGLTFIFHKHLAENIHQQDNTGVDYDFLNEVANMHEQKFYDELEYQIFNYRAIDPAYIVRRYNEKYLIAWGYDAFRKGKRSLRFPFESLLPLDNIIIGEHCQLDPFELLAKHGIYNLVTS